MAPLCLLCAAMPCAQCFTAVQLCCCAPSMVSIVKVSLCVLTDAELGNHLSDGRCNILAALRQPLYIMLQYPLSAYNMRHFIIPPHIPFIHPSYHPFIPTVGLGHVVRPASPSIVVWRSSYHNTARKNKARTIIYSASATYK